MGVRLALTVRTSTPAIPGRNLAAFADLAIVRARFCVRKCAWGAGFRSMADEHFAEIRQAAGTTTRTGGCVAAGGTPPAGFWSRALTARSAMPQAQNLTGKATATACAWITSVYAGSASFIGVQLRRRQIDLAGQPLAHARTQPAASRTEKPRDPATTSRSRCRDRTDRRLALP